MAGRGRKPKIEEAVGSLAEAMERGSLGVRRPAAAGRLYFWNDGAVLAMDKMLRGYRPKGAYILTNTVGT